MIKTNGKKKDFQIVYTIVQRGGRKFWVRVGAAFPNRDGSINVVLDAVPVNGELQIRDYRPYEGRDGLAEEPQREREAA